MKDKYIVDREFLRWLISDFAKWQIKDSDAWDRGERKDHDINEVIYKIIDKAIAKGLKRKFYGRATKYKKESNE
jgi:hypothetical protein